MERFVVNGPCKLNGSVNISGAKNAAVAIIPATLLVKGKCHLENVPDISDIREYLEILKSIGSKLTYITKNEIIIDNSNISTGVCSYDLTSKFRASYYLLGSLINRFDDVRISLPGGCNLGARPIDQHIKILEKLGANISVMHGNVYAKRDTDLFGTQIFLDVISVGATINAILAATLTEGITIIENVAKEPHIVDVANFLNSMGAKIKGAGTDIIKIIGVKSLTQTSSYSIIPDQIEAGTFMIAAAVTKGNVKICNIIPKHLESITSKLIEAGVNVVEGDTYVTVSSNGNFNPINIKTMPYPGFPTDMQPQMCILLCLANGNSMIVENIWESRFLYTDELIKMGANISTHASTCVITGVTKLYGSPVTSHDLRAGAAMIIAGLVAEGTTYIKNISHILRGYEDIVTKLKNLGADILKEE